MKKLFLIFLSFALASIQPFVSVAQDLNASQESKQASADVSTRAICVECGKNFSKTKSAQSKCGICENGDKLRDVLRTDNYNKFDLYESFLEDLGHCKYDNDCWRKEVTYEWGSNTKWSSNIRPCSDRFFEALYDLSQSGQEGIKKIFSIKDEESKNASSVLIKKEKESDEREKEEIRRNMALGKEVVKAYEMKKAGASCLCRWFGFNCPKN